MSLRVLLIANTLPPTDVSGVGEQVVQLADGLRERGCEVRILGRAESGLGSIKALFPLTVVSRALREVHRFRPEVVQTHESDGGLVVFFLAVVRDLLEVRPRLVALFQVSYRREFRAVRRLNLPTAAQVEPSRSEKIFKWTRAPWHILLGLLSARSVDQVLAPSRQTLRELEEDYGVTEGAVLPNAMIERKAQPEPVAIPDHEQGLLIVGRMRVRKGIEVALAALASMPTENRPRLWLAGDGEHRPGLEAAAERLRLQEHVRFLGRCTAGQVLTLLNRTSALLVPSTYEGMPLVILEAMSESCPVVASAVSGIPEVVIDGETGWLVPAEDATALASAIEAVSVDQEETLRRGRAGYLRWMRYFRPQEAAAVWLERVAEASQVEVMQQAERPQGDCAQETSARGATAQGTAQGDTAQ